MVSVECRVLVAGEWDPAELYLGETPMLMAAYSACHPITCCDLQGGFFIDVDGEPWSDDGTVDEFWMTMGWIIALAKLADPAATTVVETCQPWEESSLKLVRTRDRLAMVDIHNSGNVSMRPVDVGFAEFLGEMIPAAEIFDRFLRQLQRACEPPTSDTNAIAELVTPLVQSPKYNASLATLRERAPSWAQVRRLKGEATER